LNCLKYQLYSNVIVCWLASTYSASQCQAAVLHVSDIASIAETQTEAPKEITSPVMLQ
jgi:hypothetical protein